MLQKLPRLGNRTRTPAAAGATERLQSPDALAAVHESPLGVNLPTAWATCATGRHGRQLGVDGLANTKLSPMKTECKNRRCFTVLACHHSHVRNSRTPGNRLRDRQPATVAVSAGALNFCDSGNSNTVVNNDQTFEKSATWLEIFFVAIVVEVFLAQQPTTYDAAAGSNRTSASAKSLLPATLSRSMMRRYPRARQTVKIKTRNHRAFAL